MLDPCIFVLICVNGLTRIFLVGVRVNTFLLFRWCWWSIGRQGMNHRWNDMKEMANANDDFDDDDDDMK